MLLSSLRTLLLAPLYASAIAAHPSSSEHEQRDHTHNHNHNTDSFHETLTLRPLPDGRLSVLFEFVTRFGPASVHDATIPRSHHSLTPPSLLLPLEQNNVSELTISFNSGWDQRRTSSSGPMGSESSGGGGEVRGWLREGAGAGAKTAEERWSAVTHALGGLFCATLGPADKGENVRTFGGIYPPARGDAANLTHFLLPHPESHLCTENLTPFLSLLPSKGLSGLSSLLAQPGIIFSWASQSEGIESLMPTQTADGQWTGWWEGIVDLTQHGGKRDFSVERIFRKKLSRAFPESSRSTLRLIKEGGVIPLPAGKEQAKWIDGVYKDVVEWDLLDPEVIGKDIEFKWDEDKFVHPRTIPPPAITIARTVVDKHASDGTFRVAITNNAGVEHRAVYSEIWPWWVKGWMSEVGLSVDDVKRADLLEDLSYNPSRPPSISTTTVHFSVTLPPDATLILTIPFTKLTLKYTEHRPDAERGVELPSGVLTLLDVLGESSGTHREPSGQAGNGASVDPLRTHRRRIYTNRILLDVPTPDFSMPYNVIIMSSTVMAVFFGLMQGSLSRKWGWVQVQVPSGSATGSRKAVKRE